MEQTKFFKMLVSFVLMLGLFGVITPSETYANSLVDDTSIENANTRAGTYELHPQGLEPGHDGYSYVKVGTVNDPRSGRDIQQMWSYEFGHQTRGWSAYVAKGSSNLMITGNHPARQGLGVGAANDNTVAVYTPAKYYEDSYEGFIIDLQGSYNQSVFLTSSGQLWYTGLNENRIFRDNTDTNYDGYSMWHQYEPAAGVVKVIDFALADNTLFYIGQHADESKKLYVSGEIAYNDYYASNTTVTDYRFLATNHTSSQQHNLDITGELNGEIPQRLFSQRATEDGTDLEKWLIVETNEGYLGSAYRVSMRRAVGMLNQSGNLNDGQVTTLLNSRDYIGFKPVMYQEKPATLPAIATDPVAPGTATVKRLPAYYVQSAQSYGEEYIVNFIGAKDTPIEGKIFTSGFSYYGNVSGTHYNHFRGWDNTNTNFDYDVNYLNQSAVMNRWTTGYFAENDAWGNDNKELYPGILSVMVRKTDGRIYATSEIGAAGGTVPSNSPDGTIQGTYATSCLQSNAWCYTNGIFDLENPSINPWFVSTNWNKTENIKRGYTLTLWGGAITVDQDDFLRIAARENSFNTVAARTQLIFPVVTPESTIRRVETAGAGRTNLEYMQFNYNNSIQANRENVRVVGEFMLVDQIHVEPPSFTFDGTKNSDGIHENVVGTDDNTYNPYNISVGEIYSRKYTLNEDGSPSTGAKFYLDYQIYSYNPDTETVSQTPTLSKVNQDITDNKVNIDLSTLQPGWYQIKASRHHTTSEGDKYQSSVTVSEFYVPVEIVMDVTSPLEINSSNLGTSIADSATATIRPNTSLKSHIYIENSSIPTATLGTEATATVNQETGTATKTTNVTVSNINENNVGVHTISYRVYNDDGSTATIEQQVVINDGTLVIGSDYIIQAEDFTMTYSDFSDADGDLRSIAGVKLWELDAEGKYQPVADLSGVSVTKTGWVQEEGLSKPITFSINKKDASGVDATIEVTGKIDHKPTITFDTVPLKINPANLSDAGILETGVTTADADGDTVSVTTAPASADAFVSGEVYVVTYTATDSRGNVTTATRTAIVDDGTLSVGSKYIINASNFDVRVSEVGADDTAKKSQVLTLSQPTVYTLDGIKVEDTSGILDVRYGSPAYTNVIDSYPIEILVMDGATEDTKKLIYANVTGSDSPVISGDQFSEVHVNDLDTYDATADLTMTDDYASQQVLTDNLIISPTIDGNTAPGIYKVTYTTKDDDGNTSNTFTRVVLVNNDKYVVGAEYIIYAEDFYKTVGNTDVATVMGDASVQVIRKSDAVVVDNATNVDISYGTPDYQTASTDGSYPITFTHKTDTEATITIKAVVYPEGTEIGNEYALYAEDFSITVAEAAAYMDADTADVLGDNGAKATAKKLVDNTAGTVEVQSNGIQATPGTYDVVVRVQEEQTLTKTIKVEVTDPNTVVGIDYSMRAENFSITVAEAAAYMDADTTDVLGVNGAKARGWKKSDNSPAVVEVSSNGIKAEPGVFPVEIRVQAEPSTKKTVYVTVKGSVTGDDKYLIKASNFKVDLTQGDSYPTTEAALIALAGTQVQSTLDGSIVTDQTVTVTPTSLDGYKDGYYDVTFTVVNASGNASVTVKALIITEDTGVGTDGTTNYAVTADDFFIDKRTGSGYVDTDYDTSAKIVALANAVAINTDTLEEDATQTVVANPSSYSSQGAGKYETTYTVGSTSVSTKANVYIFDDTSTVDPDSGVVINGNDFSITSSQAKTLDETTFVDKSLAHAFNFKTEEIYTISIDATDLAAVKTGISNIYSVKITAAGHATPVRTIKVTVTDDNGAITGDGKYLLQAYDFKVDLRVGETLPTQLSEFVSLGKVVVKDTATNQVIASPVGLSVSPTTMAGYKDGVYDITFTLANPDGDAVVTVKAVVLDDTTGEVTIDGVDYAIFANNFVIDKRSTNVSYLDADYDSSEDIVGHAGAYVYNLDTYAVDATKTLVADPSSFVGKNADAYLTKFTIEGTTGTDVEAAKIKVFIMDDTTTLGPDGTAIAINAKNVSVTNTAALALSEQDLIDLADAHAFDSVTAEEYLLDVDNTHMAAINTGVNADYPAKFTVIGQDAEDTIIVTVGGDGVVTGDGKYLLKAYDFVVDRTQGDTLPGSKAEMITISNASVTVIATDEPVTDLSKLVFDPAVLTGYKDGVHAIDVSYPSDDGSQPAELSVVALIIDDDTGKGQIGGVDYLLTADNFLINKTLGTYDGTNYNTSAKLVTLANAVAIDKENKFEDHSKTVLSTPTTYENTPGGTYTSTYKVDTTDSDITTTGYVFIIDEDSVQGKDGMVINADNFSVDSATAKTMSVAQVIAAANASAFDKRALEPVELKIDDAYMNVINAGVAGVYEIALKPTISRSTEAIIFVTITDDKGVLTGDSEQLLTADDFIVDLVSGDTLPVNNDEFVTYGQAVVTNTADGTKIENLGSVTELTVSPTTMAGYTDGLYDVTYTYNNGNSTPAVVTVKALVIDDNSGKGQIGDVDYVAVANNFVIDKRSSNVSYSDADYDEASEIVSHAGAVAINAETKAVDSSKTITPSVTSFVSHTAGTYPVDYVIDSSVITAKAKVFVLDDSSHVGADGVVINASSFSVTSEVAKDLTEADFLKAEYANATAFDMNTGEELTITINGTDLTNVNTGVTDIYPVKVGVVGSETVTTINVTVTDDNGAITGDGKQLLTAYDFTVDKTSGGTLPTTLAEFISLGNVKVKNTNDNSEVTDIATSGQLTVSPTTMAGYTDGLYDVTYTFDNGNSTPAVVVVKALVIDEDSGTGQIGGVNYAVIADDIFIDKRTGSGYDSTLYDSSDELVALANAIAINADTREVDASKVIVSDPTTYATEPAGDYDTTYTIQGETIAANAKVYIYDDSSTVDPNSGIVINGSGFSKTSAEAKNLDAKGVIDAANASAFNPDTKEVFDVVVDATDLAAINTGVSGVYEVELSVVGSDAPKTIYVTVTDDDGQTTGDGKYLLQAYDFTVDLTNSETLPTTINEFVSLAKAKITDTTNGSNITDYSNLTTSPATMAGYVDGLYEVTFTLADASGNAVVTVNVLVIDDNTGTGQIGGVNYAVIADDIFIDKRTGSGYDSTLYDSSDELVALANATAINADTRVVDASKTIVSNPTTYATEPAGDYDTTYTISGETIQTTAKVYIYDDSSTVDPNSGIVINGSGFSKTSDEAKDLTAQDVIDEANASAFNPDTKEVFDVIVDATDLADINTGVSGVYEVELSVVGSDAPKTIYVTVTDDDGQTTGDGKYLLQAYDFTVDLTASETLPTTINEFVALAKAKITDTTNGNNITDYSNLTTSPATMAGYVDGLYEVTFTLADASGNAVVTVNVLVIDDNTGTGQIGGVNYAVIADDIFIDKRTGSGYDSTLYDSSDELVALANATAINADTRVVDASKTIVSNPTTYATEPAGDYDTTYTISGETIQTTAKVYIYDDSSTVDPNSGIVINGNGFSKTSEEAKDLSAQDIIDEANASAFNPDTKEVFDIIVDPTDLAAVNTGITDVYAVELSVDGSDTPKTIYITVTGDDGVLTGDGKYLLQAFDFTVDLTASETLPTTINEFVSLAKAKIKDTSNGNLITDYSNLSTSPATMAGYTDGLYKVTFTLADDSGDAVITVNALVIDDNTGTGTIGTANYAVTADDIFIDKRTGSGYDSTLYDSSDELVVLANAVAINVNTRELDATKKVVSDPTTYATEVAGDYESTYTIEGETISTVATVYIYDDSSEVGADGVVINGNGFSINESDALDLDAQGVIDGAGASAFNPSTKEVFDVVVSQTDIDAIKAGGSGVYPVELSVDGSDTTKTIYVTVTGDDGATTGDGKYLLNAYDFTVDLTASETLPTTIAEFVTLGSVKITDTTSNTQVTDYSNLSTTPASMAGYVDGLYDVEYRLADASGDAVLVVKALVIDENTGTGQIGGVDYAVIADDIFIDKRTGSGYDSTLYDSSDELVALANAVAINAETREVDEYIAITSSPTTYATEAAGDYDSTYTADTITTVAKVYIYDDSSTVDPNSGIVINGNGFSVDSSVAQGLTDGDIIDMANASAFNPDTKEVFDVIVDPDDLADLNTGVSGVYEVELSVDGSDTPKTIYITVTDDNGAITGDGKYLLQAYDFTVDLTAGGVLPTTINEFVTVANAKVTETANGTVVTDYSNLTTEPSSMAGYTDGLYEVTFTFDNGSVPAAVVKVKALVIDDNTGTGQIGGVEYAVTADNFVIDKRSTNASYVDTDYDGAAKIVAHANAKAINADSREYDSSKTITPSITDFTTQLAGSYEVTYTIDSTDISTIAYALIIDDTSEVGADGVVINAVDFTVPSDDAKLLTSADFSKPTYANATAFNMFTLEELVVVVNPTDLSAVNAGISGVYEVELGVANSNTTKVISVTVVGDSVYELTGKPGLIHTNAVDSADLASIFELSVNQVYAGTNTVDYDLNDATFTVDGKPVSSDLKPGMYMVNVTLDDLTLTLPLAIFDDTSIIANDKILYVDVFYLKYTQDEAKGMTLNDILKDANARAYDLLTGEELDIRTLSQSEIDKISAGNTGTYQVVIKVNPEATITVEVVPSGIVETGAIDYLFYVLVLLLLLMVSKYAIRIYKK